MTKHQVGDVVCFTMTGKRIDRTYGKIVKVDGKLLHVKCNNDIHVCSSKNIIRNNTQGK